MPSVVRLKSAEPPIANLSRPQRLAMTRDIPAQEQVRKWFRSHLLGRELELQELYELPPGDLDLLMAETAEIRSDTDNKARSHGRWCTAGYVLELARIIDARRSAEDRALP